MFAEGKIYAFYYGNSPISIKEIGTTFNVFKGNALREGDLRSQLEIFLDNLN